MSGLIRIVGTDTARSQPGGSAVSRLTVPSHARLAVAAALGCAAAAGPLVALAPRYAMAGAVVVALMALVWVRPAFAAYLVIGVTPLIVGVNRGTLIPVVRLNEALDLLVGGVLGARWLLRLSTGGVPRVRLTRVELALVLMAVTNSVMPLLWLGLRQQEITNDDLSYAIVLWKYLGIYFLVRACVRTDREVRRCLWISMAAAAVVSLVAIAQSLQLFGVPGLLATHFAANDNEQALFDNRGSSTLALPAAVADLMIYNLAIAIALLRRQRRHHVLLAGLAAVFALGAISAGEFSGALGLMIGIGVTALVTGGLGVLKWAPALIPVVAVGMRPVIEARLSGFASASGLPVSWTGRLYNLNNYFWPQLFSGGNWILGVQPAARVVNTHKANGYIWIESGYTWLLWSGGLPLLASFLFFVWVALRQSWWVARDDPGPLGVAGVAVFAGIVVMTLLMAFDPHLTYRGAADSLFGLLALTALAARRTIRGVTAADTSAQDGH